MKQFISIFLLILLGLIPSVKAEPNTFFIKGDAGISFAQSFSKGDYDGKKPRNSGVFGVGVGKNLKENLSLDATLYHFHDHKFNKDIFDTHVSQNIRSTALFLNMYLMLMNYNIFSPFIGFGVGCAHNEAGDYVETESKHIGKTTNGLAWSAAAGVKAKVNQNVDLVVQYKYFDLGHLKTQPLEIDFNNNPNKYAADAGAIKTRLRSHAVLLGFIVNF